MIQNYSDLEILEATRKSVEIERAILRKTLQNNYYAFVKYFWDIIIHEDPVWNWHIRYLCNEIQFVCDRVIEGKPKLYDLLVNIPPGTSKSTICSVMLNAWLWCKAPWIRLISGSHDLGLSVRDAIWSRDIMKSQRFQDIFPETVIFKTDQDGKTFYKNMAHGFRLSTSTGANIMGHHAHLITLDDLINPKEVQSETILDSTIDWLSRTIPSRKVDKKVTPMILLMQRLHQLDPAGYWEEKMQKEGMKLKVIRLPADNSLNNIEPKKLKHMYQNGLLDPIRLDRQVLEDSKIQLGTNGFAGQFLQSPMPDGGNIIKREWIVPFTQNEIPKRNPTSVFQSWDTAFKKGKENAHNVCTTWEEYPNGYYLVDVFCEKLNYPELKAEVVAQDAKWRPHGVIVEDKATGTPLIQELSNNTRINFIPILPEGDKVARAHAVSPTFEAKNVYIRTDASWSSLVIEQLTMFPNCKILDIMDSVSQYINHMRTSGGFDLNKFHGGLKSSVTKGY